MFVHVSHGASNDFCFLSGYPGQAPRILMDIVLALRCVLETSAQCRKERTGQMLPVVDDTPVVFSRALSLTVTTDSFGLSWSQI